MKNIVALVIVMSTSFSAWAWNTPTISSPADGSVTWTGVTLNWNAVSNSQRYQCQIDTTPDFNSPALRSVTNTYINTSGANNDTRYDVTNLIFGQTYYWRVRAWVSGDTSAWSTVRTLETRDFVTPSSPLTGTVTWTGTRINWAPHDGVARYEWQIDTSLAFNSPAGLGGTKNYINSTDGNSDTQHDLTNLLFGTQYYWRVRAINNHPDTSGWSTVNSFTTRDFVTPSSPLTGATTWTGTRINWAPHDGVARYEWQIDTSLLFNSPMGLGGTKNYINSTDGNSDTQHDLTDILFGTQYYWRVRAINNYPDTSEWSTVNSFTTRDFVTLISPANGAINRSVGGFNLDWDAHDGVDRYQVQLDTNSAFLAPLGGAVNTYVNTSGANADTRYATGALLANTIYFWRVRAWNAVDTSEWTTWAFNTGSTPIIYPDAPNLIAPANGATLATNNTLLQWGSVTDATRYSYMYANNTAFNNPVSGITTDTSITISNLMSNATYYWRVQAFNGNLPSANSSVWTFVTPAGTIATDNPSSSTYCAGGAINIGLSGTGTFTSSSTFTLQLSDASGSFANPQAIGFANGAMVSAISGTIPSTVATGTGYKVRVVSGMPNIIGSPNNTAFSIINTSAAPTITGTSGVTCLGSTVILNAASQAGATFTWILPDNSSQSAQSITISNFNTTNEGVYSVSYAIGSCISPSDTVSIVLNNGPPVPVVNSNANSICLGDTLQLSTAAQSNATYAWSGPDGFTSTLQNPNVIMSANGGGIYSVTVTQNGCSATGNKSINQVLPVTNTISNTICFGQNLDGYTSTGTYVDTFVASNGCDSIRTLLLTVRPQITTTENITICSGQTYQGYFFTGTYVDTFTAASGCDSVRTLILSVNSPIIDTVNTSICFGQNVDGYSNSGTYTDTFMTVIGCDSIRTLNLTVVSAINTTVNQTICFGDSFEGYTTAGTFSDTYTSSGGCDSTRILNLTIRPQNTTTVNQTICFGQSYDGYGTSGTYTDTFIDANGCDSLRTLNLLVRQENTSTINQTICFGQTFQGQSVSGVYTTSYTDAAGCDSTVVLNLTVLPENTVTVNQSICQGESYEGYTSTGTYTDTFTTSNGCDSTRILVLAINNFVTQNRALSICSNDTLIINGNQITVNGIYNDTIASTTTGCDTIYTFNVEVLAAPDIPVIVLNELTGDLEVAGFFDQLQWYKDGVEIPNANFNSLPPMGDGAYTVLASSANNLCTALSNPYIIGTGTGIGQSLSTMVKFYPVPASTVINLEFTLADDSRYIRIMDITGKTVVRYRAQQAIQSLDVSALNTGMYFLQVTGDGYNEVVKVIKE